MNSNNICMDCLDYCTGLVQDKGQFICGKCYHRRYSKRKYANHNVIVQRKPTMKDVKQYLESWKN